MAQSTLWLRVLVFFSDVLSRLQIRSPTSRVSGRFAPREPSSPQQHGPSSSPCRCYGKIRSTSIGARSSCWSLDMSTCATPFDLTITRYQEGFAHHCNPGTAPGQPPAFYRPLHFYSPGRWSALSISSCSRASIWHCSFPSSLILTKHICTTYLAIYISRNADIVSQSPAFGDFCICGLCLRR